MDQIWIDMYNAAKAVLGGVTISDYVTAGEVSAAVRSKSGKNAQRCYSWPKLSFSLSMSRSAIGVKA